MISRWKIYLKREAGVYVVGTTDTSMIRMYVPDIIYFSSNRPVLSVWPQKPISVDPMWIAVVARVIGSNRSTVDVEIRAVMERAG